jgi:phage shock protein A
MSIMRRMRDITVATLNERLDQAEDPVRLIDQFLSDRKEQIIQLEKLYQQTLTHAQSVRQQYLTAEQLKEKRERQAELAVKAGEELMARMALQEKLQHEERSEQYRGLYEQSKQAIIDLEDEMKRLKAEYQEVLSKRQYYMDRLEAIRLQRRMNERFSTSGPMGSRVFDRLEDRVSDLEFETRALRDVRRQGQEALYRAGSAVQEALDAELAALKRKLEQEGWMKS